MSGTDAFVFVTVEAGETSPVAGALTELSAVRSAHVVTGEYDVLAQVDVGGIEVETHDWLQTEIDEDGRSDPDPVRTAVERIRDVDGVAETSTALAFGV